MSQEQISTIEIKGITRNRTKIGVEDGQAEDLINMRFTDGAWRASGEGRQVWNLPSGTSYSQLYIHTNVYRHMLGVSGGKLYWFADIASDGVTFTAKATPVELTSVTGDVWITQTGHFLTIIDEADDFEYFVFRTNTEDYKKIELDVNGQASSRKLYPFGSVHFNLYSNPNDGDIHSSVQVDTLNLCGSTYDLIPSSGAPKYWNGKNDPDYSELRADGFIDNEGDKNATKFYHNTMVELYGKTTEKNGFTRPFLAIAAYKLYDGSYLYCSNPALLYPREVATSQYGSTHARIDGNPSHSEPDPLLYRDKAYFLWENGIYFKRDNGVGDPSDSLELEIGRNKGTPFESSVAYGFNYSDNYQGHNNVSAFILDSEIQGDPWTDTNQEGNLTVSGDGPIRRTKESFLPVYSNGVTSTVSGTISGEYEKGGLDISSKYRAIVFGSRLTLNIEDYEFLDRNSDVFQSLCIFVTQQADLFPMEKDNSEGNVLLHMRTIENSEYWKSIMTILFRPKRYNMDKVVKQLMDSPFFLLKEYNKSTIAELKANPIIDLSRVQDEGVLKNITQQDRLSIEALSRTTYLPKGSYMYNNRLHIFNYKSSPFYGYPVEQFHLHNHSVSQSTWFKGVLKNIGGYYDEYVQIPRNQKNFPYHQDLEGAPVFIVKVLIDTQDGEQIVCRYIPAYNPSPAVNGRADFIEDLNPLLSYPDSRAKTMIIYYVDSYDPNDTLGVDVKYRKFPLKPHLYLNMAYYIEPNLHPITLSSFASFGVSHPNFIPDNFDWLHEFELTAAEESAGWGNNTVGGIVDVD